MVTLWPDIRCRRLVADNRQRLPGRHADVGFWSWHPARDAARGQRVQLLQGLGEIPVDQNLGGVNDYCIRALQRFKRVKAVPPSYGPELDRPGMWL